MRIFAFAAVVIGAFCTSNPSYSVDGAYDVGTLENSIFNWGGKLYMLENIGCNYINHAGRWFPAYQNHSYARIREFATGHVVANISSSVRFGFLSAFPDHSVSPPTLWLFGTPNDRCTNQRWALGVHAWWTTDLLIFQTAPIPAFAAIKTENVEVASVVGHDISPRYPVNSYVMILEPFTFRTRFPATAGAANLLEGWTDPGATMPPQVPSGGPSIRAVNGAIYVITGGQIVWLTRTQDFVTWRRSRMPFVLPRPGNDSRTSAWGPLGGSPSTPYAVATGWNHMAAYPEAWDWNSNDVDVCCAAGEVPAGPRSYLVWGASTQGACPHPPLNRSEDEINAVGSSRLPLSDLLESFF